MNFENLQKVGEFKNTVKANELEINKKYIITHVKAIKTQFGDAIILEMDDCQLFLPKRYNEIFGEEAIKDFNKNYAGRSSFIITEFKKYFGKDTPIIKFLKV